MRLRHPNRPQKKRAKAKSCGLCKPQKVGGAPKARPKERLTVIEKGREAKLVGPPLHTIADCFGQWCPFHCPSPHHMRTWRKLVRYDRHGMTERLCPHGIGHPDPDSLAWMGRNGVDDAGVHGCDGCCAPPTLRKQTCASS